MIGDVFFMFFFFRVRDKVFIESRGGICRYRKDWMVSGWSGLDIGV